MILTVCPSPCIDINIEVDSLKVGLSNKIISKKIFYTGKSINVSIGLARLKTETFCSGFMYEENGNQFERELHREGVPYKFVWNKGRVRENYKIIDRRSMLTEINDISSEISAEKQDELIELVSQISQQCEAVVISGGLAKGMTPDFYSRVLKSVPQSVVKVVDSEGERLLEALKCGVKLVKPNLEELEHTLQKSIKTRDDVISACKELVDMGTEYVLLSLGKGGAIITDGNIFYKCTSINVAKNSTLGAGDAMVAAATATLLKGGDMSEILRSGVAAGTASVTLPDTLSFRYEKYLEILNTLTVYDF